ncbi:excalibur calcium-binding domain-containing protein [Dactylosporangium sp. NPDC050688]|uniref:excalibur calcium-binding domain-containing protein n=1 Tax=Dactylosporangium sp. NPDC050688 TaxID=3157217 RepID=UPI0033F9FD15
MTSARLIAAAAVVFALAACGADPEPSSTAGQLAASPSQSPSPSPSDSPSPSPSPSSSAAVPSDVAAPGAGTPAPKTPPAVKTTKPAAPKTTAPAAVYYKNCDAVKAAGKAPLYRGQPGYRSGLDRDGDGVACER